VTDQWLARQIKRYGQVQDLLVPDLVFIDAYCAFNLRHYLTYETWLWDCWSKALSAWGFVKAAGQRNARSWPERFRPKPAGRRWSQAAWLRHPVLPGDACTYIALYSVLPVAPYLSIKHVRSQKTAVKKFEPRLMVCFWWKEKRSYHYKSRVSPSSCRVRGDSQLSSSGWATQLRQIDRCSSPQKDWKQLGFVELSTI